MKNPTDDDAKHASKIRGIVHVPRAKKPPQIEHIVRDEPVPVVCGVDGVRPGITVKQSAQPKQQRKRAAFSRWMPSQVEETFSSVFFRISLAT